MLPVWRCDKCKRTARRLRLDSGPCECGGRSWTAGEAVEESDTLGAFATVALLSVFCVGVATCCRVAFVWLWELLGG